MLFPENMARDWHDNGLSRYHHFEIALYRMCSLTVFFHVFFDCACWSRIWLILGVQLSRSPCLRTCWMLTANDPRFWCQPAWQSWSHDWNIYPRRRLNSEHELAPWKGVQMFSTFILVKLALDHEQVKRFSFDEFYTTSRPGLSSSWISNHAGGDSW